MKYLIFILFISINFGQVTIIPADATFDNLEEASNFALSLCPSALYPVKIEYVKNKWRVSQKRLSSEITESYINKIDTEKEITKLWKAYAKLKKQNKQKPKRKPNAVYLNLDKMDNPKYMLTWYIAGESDKLKVQRLTHINYIHWQKNDTLYVYVPKP